jgi:hypothetical protein
MRTATDTKNHAAGHQAAQSFAWCSPVMAPGALLVSDATATCTKKIRPVSGAGGPSWGGSY